MTSNLQPGYRVHLTALFDLSLLGRASRAALDYVDAAGAAHTLTFGQIEARANQMAHELVARGLTRGDRLCVHLANRVEFIDLFLACTRLGVIFVPMDVLYRERELRQIVADAVPVAVVVAAGADAMYPDGATLWPVETLRAAADTRPTSRVLEALDVLAHQ
jgi:acyl-CoA synthetase (AMP-forming)/AMP-acid ligase II